MPFSQEVKQINTLCFVVMLCCFGSVLPVPVQPILILHLNANGVMLTVVVLPCVFVSLVHPHHGCRAPPHPVSFVFLCVCSRVLTPALLLNNPAYHVVLSDDRKGSRPLVVPSASQAQEKSLNVPQGKRAQNGPAAPGRAHTRLQLGRRWRHV